MVLTFIYIVFIIQIFFWGYLSTLFFKKNKKPTKQYRPSVSVIVCARNESDNLPTLINDLLNQTYYNFEVIIVNDRSTDQTLNILQKINSPKFSFITIDKTPDNYDHKKFALKKGIEVAKNEFLLLTDADCSTNSDTWIESMLYNLEENTDVVVGASFYTDKKGWLNSFIHYETALTAFTYFGLGKIGLPYMGVGRNLGYKKSIVSKDPYKKHKNHQGGDDDLLFKKTFLKKRIQFVSSKSSITWSYPKSNLKEYLAQKTRHLSTGTKYNFYISAILAVLTISHVLCYILPLLFVVTLNDLNSICFLFTIRSLFLVLAFKRLSGFLNKKPQIIKILANDFIFIPYIVSVSFFLILNGPIKWKK